MNQPFDFKKIWNQQTENMPDAKEIFAKAKLFKKKNLQKLILTNIMLLLTCVFIGLVWYHYQPEWITTKIGIVVTILAMFIYLFVYNQMIPLFANASVELDTHQYLQQLLTIQRKQAFLQKTMLNLYFALLSIGISLYMLEYTARMKIIWAIVAYAITLAWIAFNWFYLRPKQMQKQQQKINELIQKMEAVKNQFD
jgi:membrane protein YdbS with pleckstrin-like domain